MSKRRNALRAGDLKRDGKRVLIAGETEADAQRRMANRVARVVQAGMGAWGGVCAGKRQNP